MVVKFQAVRLETQALGAARGYRVLFSNLELKVEPGECLELRGPNGSGKSTLLRILAGLTRAQAGEVRYLDAPDGVFRQYLGHHDGVKPNETARSQVRFWSRFNGLSNAAADAALERVGLAPRADVPGRGLSAGQKRRLALARLVMDPKPVWLLDEPTAALDVAGASLVRDLAAEHCANGGIVIAAIHGEGFSGARRFAFPEVAA